ncbi:hypothetical protein [Halopseudomonas laoshanensis]|uniref:hypothetical protein n=1 Tax=Halopseudomonas laoshanensis TaxID=2268758 RepID=UPI003734C3DF
MNSHFRRKAHPDEDNAVIQMPTRTYARFDHLEADTAAHSVLLAFDLVDAQWLDMEGQRNPLLNAEWPSNVARAWNHWTQLPLDEAPDPFEAMPLYRLEFDLSDGQLLFNRHLPPAADLSALRGAASELEWLWFEIEIHDDAQQGGMEALLYPGLFANPLPVYVKGQMPSLRKHQALSTIFSLAHLPTLSTEQVQTELSHATADLLAVFDVGQGNANALLSTTQYGEPGVPTHYYDLGAGVYRNRHTTPDPLAFCFCDAPLILLSHWDADHWAGTYAVTTNNAYPALRRKWIAPLQVVGPLHIAFAHDIISNGGEIFIYSPSGKIGEATLSPQRRIRFMCGNGRDRNGTGIVLAVEEHEKEPRRSWLLTGDCDYLYFVNELQPLPPVGMVVPHHGADLDRNSPIPRPPPGVDYKRLVYSYGPGNKHGRAPVQHPTYQGVAPHNSADWDHNRWTIMAPGYPAPGGDVLATCEHVPGTSRGCALIGWDHPPRHLFPPCHGF